MATCEFCGAAIGREGAERLRCRVCRAGYEVTESRHTGKVSYSSVEDPPPELYNLALVRRRLLEAASKVVAQPATALELLADTWVELTTYVKGETYCPEAELTMLKTRVALLEALVAEAQELPERVFRKLTELHDRGLLWDPACTEVRDEIQDWRAGFEIKES